MRFHRSAGESGIFRRLAIWACLVSGCLSAASPLFFEPAGGKYVASSHGQFMEISTGAVRMGSDTLLTWRGAGKGVLGGEEPNGGVSHYLAGSNQAQWQTDVPHYSRVRVRDLYRNVDISYYFRGERFEFDVEARPGFDPNALRFQLAGAKRLALEASGDLTLEAGGQSYRFHSPLAWQMRDGLRTAVACRYALDAKQGVGFRLGDYDHTRELIIDPVVEFLTYLGGSGIDRIQAIGADAAGNVVVAGVTNSVNFPGGVMTAPGTMSIFVTKLNSTGTAILFTTFLGSRPNADASYVFEYVSSLAVDSDGSIYVTGLTLAQNFPTTSGAWQQNSSGGFITRLDANGKPVYSTLLGPQSWGLNATRVRLRNGIAYIAGNVSRAEFLGTSGALQRGIAGGADFFALAMAADGSGPLFATAFGGSGTESLRDMTLDGSGNIVLAGTSDSRDLPLTADALPYRTPADNTSGAVLVRIDPSGSRLISSTWLGTSSAGAITTVPDGGVVMAGGGPTLPADLISGAPHYSISFPGRPPQGYIAKFPAGSNRPVWTTDLSSVDNFGWGISADSQGNLYWPGYPYGIGGGGLAFSFGPGISKLSADGSRLLYASPIPGYSFGIVAVAGAGGSVYLGGYTNSSTLPVTPGVVQPRRDPAPSGTFQNPLNFDDGFVGVFDLSSFSGGNFFAVPPINGTALTWRIGEPAPKAYVQPITLYGGAGQLTVTPSSRLTASYSASPSPAINISVDTTQSVPGTFQESVTVQSQSNPDAKLAIPLTITVQPQVSFDLATNQVNIRFRQGQQHTVTKVAITPNFGSDYFSFSVASSAAWMYGNVDQFDVKHPVLSITTADQPPGTYDGTLTVSLQGFQNSDRVLQVHYVVDPPATLQLSATTIRLHVVKGQPVTPAVITVTGSVPGVPWEIFAGVHPIWLQVTQTTTTTPGEIHVTVDPATVEVGYWGFNLLVRGEAFRDVSAFIAVDVSSGAPLDVVPNSISYQFFRGGLYQLQAQILTFTTPAPATVQWKADQPWIGGSPGSFPTPVGVAFVFDTTLPEGVYQGKITASVGANSVIVPVTWKLYDVPHLVFPSNPISFQWHIGDPPPAAQLIQFTCPTITQDYFIVGPTDSPTFLKVDQPSGITPVTVKVTADPTGLAVGTYKSNLSIRPYYPDSTIYPWIPVTLTVLPDPNAPKATVARVTDAASYLGGAVAPGEVMVLFGSGLGPATLVQPQLGSDGRFPLSLAGWTVYFDDIPAPVLYLSDKQSAVMAPFGIAGRATTNVTVATGGTRSVAVSMPVAATNPAVFTANASGSGIAAAANVAADGSISPHTIGSPVSRGGVLTFYASGLGATTPVLPDGSLTGLPLPRLNASVRVLVGGKDADVLYAGPAPFQIAGLTQINIRISADAPSGLAALLVLTGEIASQPGVTLAVQ